MLKIQLLSHFYKNILSKRSISLGARYQSHINVWLLYITPIVFVTLPKLKIFCTARTLKECIRFALLQTQPNTMCKVYICITNHHNNSSSIYRLCSGPRKYHDLFVPNAKWATSYIVSSSVHSCQRVSYSYIQGRSEDTS